jgi:hypothetical protein
MTTKLELIQAAQSAAAQSLNLEDPKEIHAARDDAFTATAVPDTNRQLFNDHFQGARHQYHVNKDEPLAPAKAKAALKVAVQFALITAGLLLAHLLDHAHDAFHGMLLPFLGSWNPTTGATGAGNVAAGQYAATGQATTILWGTNTNSIWNGSPPTGWLTITKFSQKTTSELIELPNGDGIIVGTVQLIQGFIADVEVRDDTTQVTTALTTGQRIYVYDNAGLVPGGARGAQYRGIIGEHSWDTAPKTPAGRILQIHVYLGIA